jgi:hypothetical protein
MDTIDCPKCKHEHEPAGYHEVDSGERECDKCRFKFEVVIEYDPYYDTGCVEHEFGNYGDNPRFPNAKFCKHCMKCELRPFLSS